MHTKTRRLRAAGRNTACARKTHAQGRQVQAKGTNAAGTGLSERCRSLLKNMEVLALAAFACDDSGRITACNRHYARQSGEPAASLLGRHYWEVLPCLETPLDGCISLGRNKRRTRRGEVRDRCGTWFAYRLHILTQGRKEGLRRMMVCSVEDVTKRRSRELALQVSEQRYRTLVQSVTDVITIVDPDGTIQYISPSCRRSTGYAPRTLVGENALAYIHPDDRAQVHAQILAALRAPRTEHRAEYRFRHREGSWRSMEAAGQSIKHSDGSREVIVTARDLSERRRAESQRLESEQRYQSIFDAAGEGIAVRDLKGCLLDLNPAYCRMLGYRREELIGRPLEPLVDRSCRADIETYRHHLDQQREARLESVLLHKNGRRIPVEIYAIRHDYGGRPATLAFVRDISERREAELARQRDAEALKRTLEETVTAISMALDKRDPYTGGHERRVASLSIRIAQELGLDKQSCEGVYLGGLVHDVGKIHIPLEILNRPGRLSAAEFAIIRAHPDVGFDILQGVHFDWPIAEIALQHHERLDGTGYPKGLHEKEILPEAKILAVADVVEAMASHRPYRPGLGIEPALAEICKHRGKTYDADAVDACVQLFQKQHFAFP